MPRSTGVAVVDADGKLVRLGGVATAMPLTGEVELSPTSWVREQTEKIFETGTTEGVTIKGRAVVLLTTRGVNPGSCARCP